MSDLTDFLLARLAEDEAWVHRDGRFNPAPRRLGMPGDRARVLADVEAKRRIVELHTATMDMPWCRSCGRADIPNGAHEWPCSTILALAAVYADHPDCESSR